MRIMEPVNKTGSPSPSSSPTVDHEMKSNNAAESGFLWKLKKIAIHAHFISIFATVILFFTKSVNLWPHPIMIMVTTLLVATFIPPFGLMDPKQFKEPKATLDATAATAGKQGDGDKNKHNTNREALKKKKKKSQ